MVIYRKFEPQRRQERKEKRKTFDQELKTDLTQSRQERQEALC